MNNKPWAYVTSAWSADRSKAKRSAKRYCRKLYEAGYYNVMRTDAVLYHHESVSRGYDYLDKQKMERLEQERNKLYNRHPVLAKRDPFYHPYLVPNNVDFSY